MQFGGWWSQLADGRTFEPSHSALPTHQATDDTFTDSNRPGTHALPDERDVGGQGDDDKHSQDGIGVVLRLWGKGTTSKRNDRQQSAVIVTTGGNMMGRIAALVVSRTFKRQRIE
jgi:hypothetical protein